MGILIFKGLTARRLYKSFGVKGLKLYSSSLRRNVACCLQTCLISLLPVTVQCTVRCDLCAADASMFEDGDYN
jgi:hypothetical protein